VSPVTSVRAISVLMIDECTIELRSRYDLFG
jgi:hypothetical protein